MDFFSSSRGKRDGKRSGLFGKKSASKSNPASPPHPADGRSPPPSYLSNKRAETEYDFPISDERTTYRNQPASERIPNSRPRPPVYGGYGTPERRRGHGIERMEPETNAPSSPFHPCGNRTPERRRKPSEYSRQGDQDRMYEADTRSNASPFHPFRSPSPSPYHTPDRHSNHGNEQFEELYERDGDVTPRNSSPPSPFHPAASRSPPPQLYRTPDRRRNHDGGEPFEAVYEADGDVMPRNSTPPSPVLGGYSSSEDDNQSTYLFPEIGTPARSAKSTQPVDHNYQIVAAETYEQEPPELADESQSFTLQEMAIMRGLGSNEKEESQSMISEGYVSVANYRVRVSVAETLQAILEKHGDIAASSKLESMMNRSYYLESLAAVVMELRSKVLRDLSKTRVAEMAAVVKDMEAVKINVGWLKQAVGELAEAVEYLGEYEAAKVEREECERGVEAGKGEMEEMRAELGRREKEIRECRERVTVVAGKLGQLEMKGSRLNKNVELFESKVHKFQGQSVVLPHL